MELKKYINKTCRIFLKNGFKYEGVVFDATDYSIFIKDVKYEIELSGDYISTIIVLNSEADLQEVKNARRNSD